MQVATSFSEESMEFIQADSCQECFPSSDMVTHFDGDQPPNPSEAMLLLQIPAILQMGPNLPWFCGEASLTTTPRATTKFAGYVPCPWAEHKTLPCCPRLLRPWTVHYVSEGQVKYQAVPMKWETTEQIHHLIGNRYVFRGQPVPWRIVDNQFGQVQPVWIATIQLTVPWSV